MMNPSPSSSPLDDDKGLYKAFTGARRQFPKHMHTESKQQKSFWSVLAKKAKSVLLDDDPSTCEPEVDQSNSCEKLQSQFTHAKPSSESKQQRGEAPMLQRRLIALTSSLSSFGGSIGNAIEESLNVMEAKAADLISSRKATDTSKANHPQEQVTSSCNEDSDVSSSVVHKESFSRSLRQGQSCAKPKKHVYDSENILQANFLQRDDSFLKHSQQLCLNAKPVHKEDSVLRPLQQHSDNVAADKETQLKASRDVRWQGWKALSLFLVAMAMAAKAKLLLRELKEAKADLAVAREHCAQLEEENRIIRASIDSGLKPDEEDLVRIQLETLLAEKARLAQENAYYARENQFLREMIEYHRLTMQSGATFGEESILEASERFASDRNDFEEADELPPETIISTIIN